MRLLTILALGVLAACETKSSTPQNFGDLLTLTDMTTNPICNLSLGDIRKNLSPEALEAAKAEAFNYDGVVKAYADDPAAQIRIIFRRAALKRRLNVVGDRPELAQEFYESFDVREGVPITLEGFKDELEYWSERVGEQSDYGDPKSDSYNLRFCVLNERRAELHAASRKEIVSRVEAGVTLPASKLIENLHYETTFSDGFLDRIMAQIFTEDNIKALSALERAKMRGREPIMHFDPKTAGEFWEKRDAEIEAIIDFIKTAHFSTTADKLKEMTNIDQSLRYLWGGEVADSHFDNAQELDAFRKGISQRIVMVDEFNTAELGKMLEGRGWFRDDIDGSGAAEDAWLIAQHADRKPNFQAKVLKMIEAEIDAPGVSKSNYAYLYDRVQMRYLDEGEAGKRLQRYGTQGRCTGPGTWEPHPIESPERIDEMRAEVGLGPIEDYKARFKNICTKDER